MIKEVEDIDTPQVLHPQQTPHTPLIQATAPSPTTEREYLAPSSSPVHRSDINTSADTSVDSQYVPSEIDWSTQAQRPDEYVLPSQASPLPFHSHLPSTPSPNPHQACQHAQSPPSTAQRFWAVPPSNPRTCGTPRSGLHSPLQGAAARATRSGTYKKADDVKIFFEETGTHRTCLFCKYVF